MADAARILILAGLAMALIGGVLWLAARSGFRGLPGDVAYDSPGFRLYFPIVTCIVISLALSAGFWLWRWMSGR